MKKLFIATAVTSVLASSAFAVGRDNEGSFFDKNFYIKLEGGAIKFNKLKENSIGVKLKSKPAAIIAVGAGGYFTDKVRADLTFGHAFNPTFKYSGTNPIGSYVNTNFGKAIFNEFRPALSEQNLVKKFDVNTNLAPIFSGSLNKALTDIANNPNTSSSLLQVAIDEINQVAKDRGLDAAQTQAALTLFGNFVNKLNTPKDAHIYGLLNTSLKDIKVSTNIKRKSQVENLMVNGYVDLVEFNDFKLFAGASVGLALLREKISFDTNIIANDKTIYTFSDSGKTKVAKNFAYGLTLGGSAKVADGVNVDLSGTWQDNGKTKSTKYKGIEVGKNAYKGYSVKAGLRFDI